MNDISVLLAILAAVIALYIVHFQEETRLKP